MCPDRSHGACGAASGIRAATARLFANEGAALVIADIHDKDGQYFATNLVVDGGDLAVAESDTVDDSTTPGEASWPCRWAVPILHSR